MLGELQQALCLPYHRYHLPIQQDQEDCQQSQGDCCTIHFYRGKCQEIYRLHFFSNIAPALSSVCRGESLQELIKPSTAIWMTSATNRNQKSKNSSSQVQTANLSCSHQLHTLRENLKLPGMVRCSNFPPPAVVDCHASKYLHTHCLRRQCSWISF